MDGEEDSVLYLLWSMDTDKILFHCNSQLLERLLPFLLYFLSALQFFLPSLIQALHKFFASFHLFLELCFGHGLDSTILGLVCHFLLLGRYCRIIAGLISDSRHTSYKARNDSPV